MLCQENIVFPYQIGNEWGLTNGEDIDIKVPRTDSISPIPIAINNTTKLYKGFNKNKAFLINKAGKKVVEGFQDYKGLSTRNLSNNLVIYIKNTKEGIYNIDLEKKVTPNSYTYIAPLFNDTIVFFKVKDEHGHMGILNEKYEVIVLPSPKWKGAYFEKINYKGKSEKVLQLIDKKYNETYFNDKGEKIENPVIEDNASFFEDVAVEEVLDSDNEIYNNQLSCKHDDTIVFSEGTYTLKSCGERKILNLPGDHKLHDLIDPRKNLKSDFVYISTNGKMGVYSIIETKIIMEPTYTSLKKMSESGFNYITSIGKQKGLEQLRRDYNGNIIRNKIVDPKFNSIVKCDDLYNTFLVSLPKNTKGYMTTNRGITKIYFPKALKTKYKL